MVNKNFPKMSEELNELLKTRTATSLAMEHGKDAFILKASLLETVESMNMNLEQRGSVFKMIADFVLRDKKTEVKSIDEAAAMFFIQAIEDANKKWLETCIKNSGNRKMRDEAKKENAAGEEVSGPFH